LASIIEKRCSLHRDLVKQQQENEALQSQIGQLQVLANMGMVTYMIAHEINNLLAPLSSYASLALKNPEDRELVKKTLAKTVQNCERATKVMESMLALVRAEKQEQTSCRLITLVEEVLASLCRDFAKDGITVKVQIPESLTIRVVPVQIQQVLMNLILNAREAMLPRGGVLTIKAGQRNDTVVIEVTDTGCGIEPDNLKNIFKSFYSTKKGKNRSSQFSGAGLGLAFCKKVVDLHGGSISVESKPARGSTFSISLPKTID